VESVTDLKTCSTEIIESDMEFSLVRRHCIALLLLAGFSGAYIPGVGAATTPKIGTILVVGDSLSAEYGLKRGSGWVALMDARLAAEKANVKVVNASISGDTTSGGRSRLPALLNQHKPGLVVIELGGNDALRGLPLAMTQDNLKSMTETAQASGAKVLLVGMQMPPNYGQDYAKKFAESFTTVSKQTKATLVPFLLKGVADTPNAAAMFQADRIHPVEAAHPVILENVWPSVKKMLK
jgi:acyl-CoA thioesterase-1